MLSPPKPQTASSKNQAPSRKCQAVFLQPDINTALPQEASANVRPRASSVFSSFCSAATQSRHLSSSSQSTIPSRVRNLECPKKHPQEGHHLDVKITLVTVRPLPVELVQVIRFDSRFGVTNQLFSLTQRYPGATNVPPGPPNLSTQLGGHKSVLFA